MSDDAKTMNRLVISYRLLQRLLGLLGLALPLALMAFSLWTRRPPEPSISHFYYTQMGGFLVGTLSAVGVFLLCYNGYPDERVNPGPLRRLWADRTISLLAGIGAIGVAMFPVKTPNLSPPMVILDPASRQTTPVYFGFMNAGENLHYLSAVLFFVCITILVLFFFPRGEQRLTWRKITYYLCGVTMLGTLAVMFVTLRLAGDEADRGSLLFVYESIAILAFALAWLAKGKTDVGIGAGLAKMKERALRK
ncbi:MAG: hypothetical protein ACT4N9_07280 [Paracoccaceae bacterium]